MSYCSICLSYLVNPSHLGSNKILPTLAQNSPYPEASGSQGACVVTSQGHRSLMIVMAMSALEQNEVHL